MEETAIIYTDLLPEGLTLEVHNKLLIGIKPEQEKESA